MLNNIDYHNNFKTQQKTYQNQHQPVMLPEVLELIKTHLDTQKQANSKDGSKDDFSHNSSHNSSPKIKVLDGTLGGGGYSLAFLKEGYKVVAGDFDPLAVEIFAANNQKSIENQSLELQNISFSRLMEKQELASLDVAVLDLGFSTNQLNQSGRGFSYLELGERLDLRYNPQTGLACWQKLHDIRSVKELSNVFYRNSGESWSKPLAKILFELIQSKKPKTPKEKFLPITVGEVVTLFEEFLSARKVRKTYPILSRIWQALRIWTNQEFMHLEKFLELTPSRLKENGLLIIVNFHSLEDKIIARFMRQVSRPLFADEYGNKKYFFKLLTQKPLKPSIEEIEKNPASRSASLRAIQKQAE